MANIELLKRLRTRFLRMRHAKHFNMEKWVQDTACGTAMCIAGHALDLQGYNVRRPRGYPIFVSPKGNRVNPRAAATRELGLSYSIASNLFYDMRIKTPTQAAERIENLIETYQPTN